MDIHNKKTYIAIATTALIVLLASIGICTLNHTEEYEPQPVPVADTIIPQFIISPYDSLFQHYADTVGWDWKMLAAVAYVESKFDTAATSAVGAKGLMQLMPVTARAMGIPEGEEQNARQSVRAASLYFAELNQMFRRVPPAERPHFVLAAYNAGFGHIQDAMRLARKYGKDRYVWHDNVATYLLLKNDSLYYTDSLCRNGRFKGLETVAFVNKVQRKYADYNRREEHFKLKNGLSVQETTHTLQQP